MYPKQVIPIMMIVGIPLLAAAFLVRRTWILQEKKHSQRKVRMNRKRSMQNRIRGWLPKEPSSTLSRASPAQTSKDQKVVTAQHVILGVLALAAVMCLFTYLSSSWVKFTLTGAFLATGGLWLAVHGKKRGVMKATLAAVLIFIICFTAAENYMFQNAGVPLTVSADKPRASLTDEQMLNVSLSQIVQNIESSQTFRFLEFEHGGNIVPVSFELWPYNGPSSYGGHLGVSFYSLDDGTYFHVYSKGGNQYVVEPGVCDRKPSSPQTLSRDIVNQALIQFDTLGTQWFYNHSLQVAQNRTGNLPTIDYVAISVFFGGFNKDYKGMTLQVLGGHHLPRTEDINAPSDSGILLSEFTASGSLTYLWTPNSTDTSISQQVT